MNNYLILKQKREVIIVRKVILDRQPYFTISHDKKIIEYDYVHIRLNFRLKYNLFSFVFKYSIIEAFKVDTKGYRLPGY